MDDDLDFDFERTLQPQPAPAPGQGPGQSAHIVPYIPANANIGQSLGNFKKNYRQTVCTYWLKNLCMKGDDCGFLHQYDPARMPVCRTLLKFGECKEPDCPFKHSMDDVKECNMYKLGFCVYGPQCRFKHTRLPGPPPDPSALEAAKPREFRNINLIINNGAGPAGDRATGAGAGYGRGRGGRFQNGGDGMQRMGMLPAPMSAGGQAPGGYR